MTVTLIFRIKSIRYQLRNVELSLKKKYEEATVEKYYEASTVQKLRMDRNEVSVNKGGRSYKELKSEKEES